MWPDDSSKLVYACAVLDYLHNLKVIPGISTQHILQDTINMSNLWVFVLPKIIHFDFCEPNKNLHSFVYWTYSSIGTFWCQKRWCWTVSASALPVDQNLNRSSLTPVSMAFSSSKCHQWRYWRTIGYREDLRCDFHGRTTNWMVPPDYRARMFVLAMYQDPGNVGYDIS